MVLLRPRLALTLALALALSVVLSLTSAAPASAASFFGSRCAGLRPVASGCAADQRLLSRNASVIGTVELWYSNACHTKWSVVRTNGRFGQIVALIGADPGVTRSVASGVTFHASDMIPAYLTTRVKAIGGLIYPNASTAYYLETLPG